MFVAVTANGTVDAEQSTTFRALSLGKCTFVIIVKTASANEQLQKTQIVFKLTMFRRRGKGRARRESP